jgi:hypothetical protein
MQTLGNSHVNETDEKIVCTWIIYVLHIYATLALARTFLAKGKETEVHIIIRKFNNIIGPVKKTIS